MKKPYNRKARNPFRVDTGRTTVHLPFRLLMGGGRGARTTRGEFLPTEPLREATRIASVSVGAAIVRRVTKGRVCRMDLRKLTRDDQTGRWYLIVDF